MPPSQQKCIYGGLTLNVDRHYTMSVTATTPQEKGIITLESNPLAGNCTTGQTLIFIIQRLYFRHKHTSVSDHLFHLHSLYFVQMLYEYLH